MSETWKAEEGKWSDLQRDERSSRVQMGANDLE